MSIVMSGGSESGVLNKGDMHNMQSSGSRGLQLRTPALVCTYLSEPLGLTREIAAISVPLRKRLSTDQSGYYLCPIKTN